MLKNSSSCPLSTTLYTFVRFEWPHLYFSGLEDLLFYVKQPKAEQKRDNMQLEGPHHLYSGTDCIGFAVTRLL